MGREEISSRTRTLVDVAMGRKKADLVIKNGQWVCVQSGEILPGTDIAVVGDRIASMQMENTWSRGCWTPICMLNPAW